MRKTKRLSFSFTEQETEVIRDALREFFLSAPATTTDNSPEAQQFKTAARLRDALSARLSRS